MKVTVWIVRSSDGYYEHFEGVYGSFAEAKASLRGMGVRWKSTRGRPVPKNDPTVVRATDQWNDIWVKHGGFIGRVKHQYGNISVWGNDYFVEPWDVTVADVTPVREGE